MTDAPDSRDRIDDLALDDLIIRGSSHTSFFGVYLATHAIHDALCMCHASVGCKVKTELHLRFHEGIRSAHRRRRYSQFIDEDLIDGSTEQLEDEGADARIPQVQPVAGHVEGEAVALLAARLAADHRARLEDRAGSVGVVGRRQPGEAGADDQRVDGVGQFHGRRS